MPHRLFSGHPRLIGRGLVAFLSLVSLAGCGSGSIFGDKTSLKVCSAGTFEPSYAAKTGLVRWKSMPVRLAFANEVTYGGTTKLSDVVRSGFSEWTTATGGTIWFQETTDTSSADIVVTLDVQQAPPAGGELGVTHTEFVGNRLDHADVSLTVWNGMTQAEANNGLRSTSAHEFGHALGIEDHSDTRGDVMYPSSPTDSDIHVSTRDTNTIKTAYCDLFGRAVPVCDSPTRSTTIRQEHTIH